MENTTAQTCSDHIIIFPFMSKGHTIPLLHLASHLLSSHPSLRISFITTPSNAPFLRHHLPTTNLLLLPFPHLPPLPADCESTDSLPSFDLFPLFVAAVSHLRSPFDSLLSDLPPPLCLISDFFLGWTLDTCQRLAVPRIVFHGMSTFSMLLSKSIWVHLRLLQDNNIVADLQNPFHVPGTPDSLLITERDIPDAVLRSTDRDDPEIKFVDDIGETDVDSWGVLVNSFDGLEAEYVEPFEAFYRKGARAWLVGPLCLFADDGSNKLQLSEEDDVIMQWLDLQEEDESVVYVSFGTQADVSDEQLDEVALGLAESGCRFVWTVRSKTWVPPRERNGLIVKWAPQTAVLNHRATGGFVSHCGWNSVVEAVSAGVAMLTWPMIAEQHLNAKMVVEELGAGLRLGVGGARDREVVERGRVRDGVRELMRGEMGKRVRARAAELGVKARMAVGERGSSTRRMEEMIEELRKWREERAVEVAPAAAIPTVDERFHKFELPEEIRSA